MAIETLIDKQDNVEIVRDRICEILAIETASQQALALAAGKDPGDWKFKVFREREHAWEPFLAYDDPRPRVRVVNVTYSDSVPDKGRSNVVRDQVGPSRFYVDCIGLGRSRKTSAGHIPGDEDAALEAHALARLVRNILMAAHYECLALPNIVTNRWDEGRRILKPQEEGLVIPNVVVSRMTLSVEHFEESPQWTGDPLELISVDVVRNPGGEFIAGATFGVDDWSTQ